MRFAHIPVLLEEVLEVFREKSLTTFFEGTVGMANHTAAILEEHPEIETYIGCDVDLEALQFAKERLSLWKDKVHLFHGNFSQMGEYLQEMKISCVDGALLDIGFSSMQIDNPERGFSFQKNGPLDMRMDLKAKVDAAKIVNTYSEMQLGKIFREYGEEPKWRLAAKAIVQERRKKKIVTTFDLVSVLSTVFKGRQGKIHPATKVFQALRIAVNDELHSLEKGLSEAMKSLCPGGRISVICFHSLEDRIVKKSMKEALLEKKFSLLTKKPMVPSREEIKKNPRSRSAKLRVAEKGEKEDVTK